MGESQQTNMAMFTKSLTSLVLCYLTVNAWYCNQFDTEKTCDAAVQCTWSHFGCVEASPYHTSTQAFPLVQSFVDCAAAWQQCGASGHPSCCQGACTCTGTTYKQCVPPQGQWQCGSPTPPPAPPTPPAPPSPPAPPYPPVSIPRKMLGMHVLVADDTD